MALTPYIKKYPMLQLAPIGHRVQHWVGEPGQHGKGTIVRYNTIDEIPKITNTDIFHQLMDINCPVSLDFLQNHEGTTFSRLSRPYVVEWDPNPKFFEFHKELLATYPDMRYKDCYGHESLVAESFIPGTESALPKKPSAEEILQWLREYVTANTANGSSIFVSRLLLDGKLLEEHMRLMK